MSDRFDEIIDEAKEVGAEVFTLGNGTRILVLPPFGPVPIFTPIDLLPDNGTQSPGDTFTLTSDIIELPLPFAFNGDSRLTKKKNKCLVRVSVNGDETAGRKLFDRIERDKEFSTGERWELTFTLKRAFEHDTDITIGVRNEWFGDASEWTATVHVKV